MERKGTEIIVQALKQEGIKTIFGYPGGKVIPLFDEFLNHGDIQVVRVRHEQAAAHAADGYARVSGKASVVVATSGPGATNTITGIATAALDSIPMVIITGQVSNPVIGTNAFQEVNILGISRPVTKHNYLVKDIENLPRILKEAFYIAQSGRPGPVLIDIPDDIQRATSRREFPKEIPKHGYHPPESIEPVLLQQAWEMIQHASRPVVYAGGGVNLTNAASELREFAEKTGIPVTTTLLGLGCIPEEHKLALGMLGMHGHYAANSAMARTDLVIALGARFDDRVTGKVDAFLAQSKIIHIDIDPSVINKIKKVDLGIVGDVKDALTGLNKIAGSLEMESWQKELNTLKKEHPLIDYDHVEMKENALRPEYIVKEFSKQTDGNALIVTDVGQHQMFVALHYTFKNPRSIVSSGGLGTMGYGLPAAIGAAFYEKDRPILLFSGDGGFQMNIQELATVRSHDLPIVMVVMNNGNLGMVKQWQDLFFEHRNSSTIFEHNPDFVKVAEAYGINGYRIGKKEDVAVSIKKALEHDGPILLEFMLDKDAYVYPMIPPNDEIKSIMEGDRP
ncbi:MAG: biosynthetic-type acetolactate synthase large subunit [Proteobacteria bacterium]|nr:biosynthetic-type acetolactate synthase large subunit [Pseudomonadota bacterium]